jgi:hypothetical protein
MIYNYLQRTRLISSHATQLGLCHGLAETARVSRCQGQRPTPRLGRPNSSGLGTPTQRRSALRQRRAWHDDHRGAIDDASLWLRQRRGPHQEDHWRWAHLPSKVTWAVVLRCGLATRGRRVIDVGRHFSRDIGAATSGGHGGAPEHKEEGKKPHDNTVGGEGPW